MDTEEAKFMQNLSPLRRTPQNIELPKIVNRNAFTYGMPMNETKNSRQTSDLIGNNYSPFAKTLSTRLIGQKSKSDTTNEPKKIKPKPDLVYLSSLQRASKPFDCTQSLDQFKTVDHSSNKRGFMNSRSVFRTNESTNTLEFQNTNAARVEQLFSIILDPKSSKFTKTSFGSSNVHIIQRDLNRSRPYPNYLRRNQDTDTTISQRTASAPIQVEITEKAQFDFDQLQDSNSDRIVDHVDFPIWTTSTHGLSRPESPAEESMDRYNHLIENCLDDTNLLNEIPNQMVSNIINNIVVVNGDVSERHPKVFVSVFEEVQKDFDRAIKKSIMDYVLKDEKEQERLNISMKPKKSVTAGRYGYPWHESVSSARKLLSIQLFCCHQSLKDIMNFFHSKYSGFRLINLEQIISVMPLTIKEFKKAITKQLKKNKAHLLVDWLQECAFIIEGYQKNIESFATDQNERIALLDKYFESASALVAKIMRYWTEQTLADLKAFLWQYKGGNAYKEPYDFYSGLALPHRMLPFKYFLVADPTTSSAKVEPTAGETFAIIDEVTDLIVDCLKDMPRIELLLFENVREFMFLKYVNMLRREDEVVLDFRQTFRKVLEANLYGFKYANFYKVYEYMINPAKCQYETERLVSKDINLEKYISQTDKLMEFKRQALLQQPAVPMNLFVLDCSKVNAWLIQEANKYIARIARRVHEENTILNRYIIDQFNKIYLKLMSPMENADECVSLLKYLDYSRMEESFQLRDQAKVAYNYMLFLSEFVHFSSDDYSLNAQALTWYEKMQPIYLSSEVSLLNNKEHWVKMLRDRIIQTKSKLEEYSVKLGAFKTRDRFSEAYACVEDLNKMTQEIQSFHQTIKNINHEEELFGFEKQTDFSIMEEIADQKDWYDKLWHTALKFIGFEEKWQNAPIKRMDPDEFESEIHNMWGISYKLTKIFNTPDYLGPLRVTLKLKMKIEALKTNTPLVRILTNPGLKPRHFKSMAGILGGVDLTPSDTTCLADVQNEHKALIERNINNLTAIVNVASKEFSLENTFTKMQYDWSNMKFSYVRYKDQDLYVLSRFEDIQSLIDDHIIKTKTITNSSLFDEFRTEVETWQLKLNGMHKILENWIKVQLSWIYLEPIFNSEDIKKQMEEESAQFVELDTIWRDLMTFTVKQAKPLKVFARNNMLQELEKALILGETLTESLLSSFEEKRMYFPRFFFLSNDELVDIINASSNPLQVEPHLIKCFEGIRKLQYTCNQFIEGMVSSENEVVKFVKEVNPFRDHGLIEKWLFEVERVMKWSLREEAVKALKQLETMDRIEWINHFPGQIVLVISEIIATRELSHAITRTDIDGMDYFLTKSNRKLESLVIMLKSNLPNLTRTTIEALIITDVHARDLAIELQRSNVKELHDFTWRSQMRYYMVEGRIEVQMVAMTVAYDYEYLGNNGRLVVTPLTERCYRTLLGAIQLNLGGAPEGPAGTGKTETSKNLAKVVAKKCVVFNCSDALDYKAMSKFFKGLAQSGVWVCFDEFNRIGLEVLSVVAQQIQTIQRAIAEQKQHFYFDEVKLKLDPTCAILITMNSGYYGRTELPDNLKILFRPAAMMVPDYVMISEISLYSKGFQHASMLAKKIVTTYRLCSEQLSAQHHYDYGMRAVKSVLDSAGILKVKQPDQPEEHIILRSIKDVNLPKFLADDVKLFNDILLDLFPGVELESYKYDVFSRAMKNSFATLKLDFIEEYAEKIMQIYEMIPIRKGIMLIGESGVGKTCCYKVLIEAINEICETSFQDEQKIHHEIINPKALSIHKLYGRFDPISQEWSDGILSSIFRAHSKCTDEEKKWIVLDGPVDAMWVDNLNTVLDDNQKLCLMSGELIQMSHKQTLIIETKSLEMASPATVSRCGMCFFTNDCLELENIADAWLNYKVPKPVCAKDKTTIELLIGWLLRPCLDFVLDKCEQFIQCSANHLVLSFFSLYECMLQDTLVLIEENDKIDETVFGAVFKKNKEQISEMTVAHFFSSIVWTIAGGLRQTSREQFSHFFNKICRGELPDFPKPKKLQFSRSAMIPNFLTVYDFVYILNSPANAVWSSWSKLCADQKITIDLNAISDYMVDIGETQRQLFYLERSHRSNRGALFVGPSGTGKTMFIKSYLKQVKAKNPNTLIKRMAFTIRTNETLVLNKIMEKLTWRRESGHNETFGAPENEKTLLFIDDVNMPAAEIYGAQTPIEVLRTLMDHTLIYDRSRNCQLHVDDLQLVCAMGPNRQALSTRFNRHFNIFSLESFSGDQMRTIFQPIALYHFSKPGLQDQYDPCAFMIIDASIKLYNLVKNKFIPTPNKYYYAYDFRDLTRVFQGILVFVPAGLPKKASKEDNFHTLVRLWIHEACRVFSDRLSEPGEIAEFNLALKDIVESEFKLKFNVLFGVKNTKQRPKSGDPDEFIKLIDKKNDKEKQLVHTWIKNLYFGDYMNSKKKFYKEIQDLARVKTLVETILVDFNKISKKPMDLVIFNFFIEHMSRISRILKQPNGNALLIGVDGTSRASTTKMATFLCEYELSQLDMPKNYSVSNWRADIKRILLKTGLGLVDTVFLFTDNQVRYESFLEDIANILSLGHVPNLFEGEELVEIQEKIHQQMVSDNPMSKLNADELFDQFVENVKAHLHVVLRFSPIGANLKVQIRKYPSLFSCCTVDYFPEWPEEGLELVAAQFLADVEIDEKFKGQVVHMCKQFHQDTIQLSVKFLEECQQKNYVTPTSYLEFIRTFKNLLSKKRADVISIRDRYKVGIEKLEFAENQIELLHKEANELQAKTLESSSELQELIDKSESEAKIVEEGRLVIEAEREKANKAASEAQAVKEDVETELAKALPLMEEATAALDTLTTQDITNLKQMKFPDNKVRMVMEAVCIMKRVKPEKMLVETEIGDMKSVNDYWTPARRMLKDLSFLNSLKEYDKDNIDADIIAIIRKDYISKPDFQPEIIKKVSTACEGICKWVIAMSKYDEVYKYITPKQSLFDDAQAKLDVMSSELKKHEDQLKMVTDKLEQLYKELWSKQMAQEKLQQQIASTRKRLERAENIKNGLGSEQTRWTNKVAEMNHTFDTMVGNVLLSAAIIAYLAAFTNDYRTDCIQGWIRACRDRFIPCSKTFSLVETIGDAMTVRDWHSHGLPNDNFSIESALIAFNANLWPLMLDPQNQANTWIKNMEQANKLAITNQASDSFLKIIENCLIFGQPLLIEDILEDVNPVLEPILLKQIVRQGAFNYISLNDNLVEYNSNFRLYMTTRLKYPSYSPEINLKVKLVNFVITPQGLQNQLLNIVSRKEMPDQEKAYEESKIQSIRSNKRLQEIEDKILAEFTNSKGDILEDESAVKILSSSKKIAKEINEKQASRLETENAILKARRQFDPIAANATVLFFTINDMASLDPMYQYSLDWFIELFNQSIDQSEKSDNHNERIRHVNDHFSYKIYDQMCRSIFERHKLLFSFLLSINLMKHHREISNDEWLFFLASGVRAETETANPLPDWLSEKTWQELNKYREYCRVPFLESMKTQTEAWKTYCEKPELNAMPNEKKFNKFQKLTLLKILRPDKVYSGVQKFVRDQIGPRFIDPPAFNLESSYKDSVPYKPLIFILSNGEDPLKHFHKLARDYYKAGKIKSVSLGQGQGPIAIKAVQEGIKNDCWVLLQNCHLSTFFFPDLEKICTDLQAQGVKLSVEFRLWLTTYSTENFPVSILENSVKITNEPPHSLRSSLLSSYSTEPIVDPKFFEKLKGMNDTTTKAAEQKVRDWKKLLFGLCFFHATVQERRKYGPLGWNISYGFNESDLKISIHQLKLFIESSDKVPFNALNNLTAECNYGGRITDNLDRRLISSMLEQFYTPALLSEDDYRFCEDKNYFIPSYTRYEDYIDHITNLPLIAHPEAFGLHDNAIMLKDHQDSQLLIDNILNTLPSRNTNNLESNQRLIGQLCQEICEKIEEFDLSKANMKSRQTPIRFDESIKGVLVRELFNFNRLVRCIKDSVSEIQKSLSGRAIISSNLEQVYNSMLMGKIPEKWAQLSYLSLKPLGSYISDLVDRLAFFKNWYQNGPPKSFWLSGFFSQQSFLTSILQSYSRSHAISIDLLEYEFDFLNVQPDMLEEEAPTGMYVHGLSLQGARWCPQENIIQESRPGEIFSTLPVICFRPIETSKSTAASRTLAAYPCPVYKTTLRQGIISATGNSTNYVLTIMLPTQKDPRHWMIRSAAIICQLDD